MSGGTSGRGPTVRNDLLWGSRIFCDKEHLRTDAGGQNSAGEASLALASGFRVQR